jgi:hypothetical protein
VQQAPQVYKVARATQALLVPKVSKGRQVIAAQRVRQVQPDPAAVPQAQQDLRGFRAIPALRALREFREIQVLPGQLVYQVFRVTRVLLVLPAVRVFRVLPGIAGQLVQ